MKQYDIDELVSTAYTTERPLILVEGADDIQIYDKISGQKYIIKAIETVPDYNEGNKSVIDAITYLQEKINNKPKLKKYILGIIDRDARYYRNEIPELECLFVLKYYSIESHFVTQTNLEKVLFEVTNIHSELLNKTLFDFIENDIEKTYKRLYYFSLEALKNACISSYQGIIGYERDNDGKKVTKGRILKDDQLFKKINKKQNELNIFAGSLNLSYNKDVIKSISKGKWLLYIYSHFILKKIKLLQSSCKEKKINQCQYCKIQKYDNCLYKLKNKNIQSDYVETILLNKQDEKELQYLYDRFSELG